MPQLPDHEKQGVLNALRSRPLGMTRREIQWACRLPADRVVRLLHSLRDEGLTRQRGSKWYSTSAQFSRGTGPGQAAATDESRQPQATEARTDGGDRVDRTQTASASRASRWDEFRRLCTYYAACVRIQGGGRIKLAPSGGGQDFFEIQTQVDWHRLAAGHSVRLRRSAGLNRFLDAQRVGSEPKRFYIGAPAHVSGDPPVLSPIFLIQVDATLEQNYLALEPIDAATVNHRWLDEVFARRQGHRRADFLISVGLMRLGARNIDLLSLWTAFNNRYPDWRNEAGPDGQPVVTPPLAQVHEAGVYQRIVLVAAPPLPFTGGLLKELEEIALASDQDLDGTALSPVFGAAPSERRDSPQSAEASLPEPAELKLLNQRQRTTCALALEAPLLVVQGPPGTGKSTVVQHVLANVLLDGGSALFASRNHRALDAVVGRLNALSAENVRPLVLRLTPPRDAAGTDTLSWLQMISDLITRPREADAEATAFTRSVLEEALGERASCEQTVREIIEFQESLAVTDERLREVERDLGEDARSIPLESDLPDSEYLGRLVQAIDPARRGQPGWTRRILAWWGLLRNWLAARRVWRNLQSEPRTTSVAIPPRAQLARELAAWSKRSRALQLLRERNDLEAKAQGSPTLAAARSALESACDRLHETTLRTLMETSDSLAARLAPEDIEMFANLRGALSGQQDTVTPETLGRRLTQHIRSNFERVLAAYPLWACTNLSLRSRLPLSPGVFDLAVVDEASQCDIASVIPLLYRAKRAMVVGDPMQLRHIALIAGATDHELREHLGLSDDTRFGRFRYGPNSIYDLASTSRVVHTNKDFVQLVEHYRCHPAIARYFSGTFYDGSLAIRTPMDRAKLRRLGRDGNAGILWTDIPGGSLTHGGSRYWPAQVDAVVDELKRLDNDRYAGTVGVVTPFRNQADRIRDEASRLISQSRLQEWQFISETADGFQGDERDLILFSLIGGGDGANATPGFYRKDVNRFNVAVSRARVVLHVFGDKGWVRDCGISHLERLLGAYETEASQVDHRVRWDLVGPVWEPKLADALRGADIPYQQQYPACGYYLDFAIFGDHLKLNVEVDGEAYHRAATGERRLEDIYRDQALTATGWRVLRFWVYELREDLEECIDRIRRELEGTARRSGLGAEGEPTEVA